MKLFCCLHLHLQLHSLAESVRTRLLLPSRGVCGRLKKLPDTKLVILVIQSDLFLFIECQPMPEKDALFGKSLSLSFSFCTSSFPLVSLEEQKVQQGVNTRERERRYFEPCSFSSSSSSSFFYIFLFPFLL